ncbi:aminopeptidase P family protein [Thalassotalea litorea]|uniref:Aminopeptidase P family protein n=1 Tax=Thalassotalea litorea TaxID=2020715 RepID=A0A5R9IXN4_9GAMM|nr:Xaa-Pro peptidase family protein [Thalassotalea litorea]TLU68111.1 aminopeptidase P family protein [Thalassotalea litorea]
MNSNYGIGGSTAAVELDKLKDMCADLRGIDGSEYQQRIARAQAIMQAQGIAAIYLNAGNNLAYFTGTHWYPSERMVGAILPATGKVEYIAPYFELDTLTQYMAVPGKVHTWHEHISPYQTFLDALVSLNIHEGNVGLDEATPFFIANGIAQLTQSYQWLDAKPVTAGCRMHKSRQEIAILQRAKDITLIVQQAAARILHPGITVTEVEQFIDAAHRRLGASQGSYFCIVLFGEDTAYPHGVAKPKSLDTNDMVLIDTGCELYGYHSDITRTYVFGQPNDRQRQVWEHEKQAQLMAFNAAQLDRPCAQVDQAARSYLASVGYGPEYQLPGLPHRTGHGIGLDIHEWPYLVGNDATPLTKGMCFSNEPMLCIPGEFGVRLEDHFYMTDDGPQWFTQPSHSIDNPFGYGVE